MVGQQPSERYVVPYKFPSKIRDSGGILALLNAGKPTPSLHLPPLAASLTLLSSLEPSDEGPLAWFLAGGSHSNLQLAVKETPKNQFG